MKLRLNKNTVRFRLSKSEVKEFAEKGFLEESLPVAPGGFTYTLRLDNSIENVKIEWSYSHILVLVPEDAGKEWANTQLVGLDNWIEGVNGVRIRVQVEKDFKCLDNTIEDQSDNYENPLKKTYE
jgi:hypothetical protein